MPRLIIHLEGERREQPFEGSPPLSAVLAQAGLALPQPCGGRGRCGKCGVKLSGAVSLPNEMEKKAGSRLACQAVLLGDSELVLPPRQGPMQIEQGGSLRIPLEKPLPGRYGAAVDLGTTTLALRLYDLENGALLASAAGANPQAAVAGDVMGRIGAALEEGGLARLQGMALGFIREKLAEACAQAGIRPADVGSLVVAGNTTMLYLLSGRSPGSLARAPFIADCLFGEWLNLAGMNMYLPPCMDAFVGADISCAVLASGLFTRDETALLADVGTNGEIALWKDGVLHVASTAAGPAFEGAGITMGCGSVPGAIDSAWLEEGALVAHTIGDAPAVGICGSGLVDAVAALLDASLVDETGAMKAGKAVLQGEVALFPADIRAVQLAKAAIAAGIKTLLQQAGARMEDIQAFYLAGGFGSHLDHRSAARIGLVPGDFASNTRAIGNAALDGASMLLLDSARMETLRRIASAGRHAMLGGNPVFNAFFMEEMLFPEAEY